jgi:hypothetical protein
MRYLLILVLLIVRTICLATDINAKSLGAKGDGIQDDSPYLNAAISNALSLGQNLFIPAGTYKCNQFSSGSKILMMDQPGIKTITIYGETGTKITTQLDTGCILYIYYQCTNVIIQNIFFENTHDTTQDQTNAIQLLGTNQNAIQNLTIQNCTFEGFSTAISAQGVQGFVIQNNLFQSPKGHDNAQNNSQPAVYIWLADNSNGQCYNVTILNNTVNGFTGNDITQTVTQRPMDGFVFGIAYGIQIKGNATHNLSEEHIALQPHQTSPNSTDSVLIIGNKFFQELPTGAMKNGAPLVSNYGVRADCNNVTITNNDFYSYTLGVLIWPYQYPNLKQHNYAVVKNRFYSPNSSVYNVFEAIKIQAPSANPASNITVSENFIDIELIQMKSSRSVISIYYCDKVNIIDNYIFGQKIDLNGFTISGILTQNCTNVVNVSNEITFK